MGRRPISERQIELKMRWEKRASRLGRGEPDEAAIYDALTEFAIALYSPGTRDELACSTASWGIHVEDLQMVWRRLTADKHLEDPAGLLAKKLQHETDAKELVLDVEAANARDRDAAPVDDGQRNVMRDERVPSEAEQLLLRKHHAFNRVVHERHRVERVNPGDLASESPEDRDRNFREISPERWLTIVAEELDETVEWVCAAVLEVADELQVDRAIAEAHMSTEAWNARVKLMEKRRRARRKEGITEAIDTIPTANVAPFGGRMSPVYTDDLDELL